MMTLTMCVVLFDIPGSKHRAVNKHMEVHFSEQESGSLSQHFNKSFTEMCLIQQENIYLADICAVRIAKTLPSHILRSNVSITLSSFTDPW